MNLNSYLLINNKILSINTENNIRNYIILINTENWLFINYFKTNLNRIYQLIKINKLIIKSKV